jgi:glutamine amidotransferase
MIAIINHGAGNLSSVKKVLDFLGFQNRIVSAAGEFKNVKKVILPGVGAFGAAVDQLKSVGLWDIIQNFLTSGGTFLGICLGMQLLTGSSDESRGKAGLNVIPGTCKRFVQGKIPQIGWNQIQVKKKSALLDGIKNDSYFYFVHGYYMSPKKDKMITATTDYYLEFPSIIEQNNIHAVQFHPEKSGDQGKKIIKNWVEKC